MKILIIQPWIRLGGAELISVHLAYQLKQRGHQAAIACTFVSLDGMPNEARELEYLLPPRFLSQACAQNRVFFLLLAPWILLAQVWIHSRNVDLLNPHNFPAGWVASLVGALRGLPVVWTCNEPPERLAWRDAAKVGIGDFAGWLMASGWVDKLLMKRSSAIYVPSEKTRLQVKSRYGRNAAVVRLGVEEAFSRPPKSNGVVRRLRLDGKFVLLLVGKLHPQKNQIVCIEALPELMKQAPDVILLLVGDGPAAKHLKEAAIRLGVEASVVFLGHMNRSVVRELYRACDVNLFPAVNQSWGFTPFEALRSGRLSVVSKDCGASEVLIEESIGLVCDPTPEAFAAEILRIHGNPTRYQQMAARGQRHVERVLTWDRYADQILGLFSQAIARGSAPSPNMNGNESSLA